MGMVWLISDGEKTLRDFLSLCGAAPVTMSVAGILFGELVRHLQLTTTAALRAHPAIPRAHSGALL